MEQLNINKKSLSNKKAYNKAKNKGKEKAYFE